MLCFLSLHMTSHLFDSVLLKNKYTFLSLSYLHLIIGCCTAQHCISLSNALESAYACIIG